jgi:hypothetical protein
MKKYYVTNKQFAPQLKGDSKMKIVAIDSTQKGIDIIYQVLFVGTENFNKRDGLIYRLNGLYYIEGNVDGDVEDILDKMSMSKARFFAIGSNNEQIQQKINMLDVNFFNISHSVACNEDTVDIEHTASAENSKDTTDIEHTASDENCEDTVDIENTASDENCEDTVDIENTASAENCEDTVDIENTASAENSEDTADIEHTASDENSEDTTDIEHTASDENCEDTVDIENTASDESNNVSIILDNEKLNLTEKEYCKYYANELSKKCTNKQQYIDAIAKDLQLEGNNEMFFKEAMEAAYVLKKSNQPIKWEDIDKFVKGKGTKVLTNTRRNCVKAIRNSRRFTNIRLLTLLKVSAEAIVENIESNVSNSDDKSGSEDIDYHAMFEQICKAKFAQQIRIYDWYKEIFENAFYKSSWEDMSKKLLTGIGFDEYIKKTEKGKKRNEDLRSKLYNDTLEVLKSATFSKYEAYENHPGTEEKDQYIFFRGVLHDSGRDTYVRKQLQGCLKALFEKNKVEENCVSTSQFISYAVLIWNEKKIRTQKIKAGV